MDELREALREMDVTLACTMCGREEFSLEEATLRGSGKRQNYGVSLLARATRLREVRARIGMGSVDRRRSEPFIRAKLVRIPARPRGRGLLPGGGPSRAAS